MLHFQSLRTRQEEKKRTKEDREEREKAKEKDRREEGRKGKEKYIDDDDNE